MRKLKAEALAFVRATSQLPGVTRIALSGYVLNSAGFVQIESGDSALHDPPLQLLWTSQTVWNNSGDKAILYNSANKPLSSACYGIGCAQK